MSTTKEEREVLAVLEVLGPLAVRVHEGGGPENVFASLAVTAVRLKERLETAQRDLAAFKTERDFKGVVVHCDSPTAAMAELERLCNEARGVANRNKEIADANKRLREQAERERDEARADADDADALRERLERAEDVLRQISAHRLGPPPPPPQSIHYKELVRLESLARAALAQTKEGQYCAEDERCVLPRGHDGSHCHTVSAQTKEGQ